MDAINVAVVLDDEGSSANAGFNSNILNGI